MQVTRKAINIGGLKIDFGIIIGDLENSSYRDNAIEVAWQQEDFQPAEPVAQLISEQWDRLAQIAQQHRRNLTDGSVSRLVDCSIAPDNKMSLTLQPTSYRLFCTTNLLLDEPLIPQTKNDHLISIRDLVEGDISEAGPYLANPLNVIAMLISTDGFTFISRRSTRVYERPGTWQASVGGAVKPQDKRPASALIRETKEEWGLDIEVNEIRFLVLGVNQKTGEPDLIACVETGKSCAWMLKVFLHHRSEVELAAVKPVELVRENLICLIRNLQQVQQWSQPSDQAAVLITLVRRFGSQAVEEACRSLATEQGQKPAFQHGQEFGHEGI